MQWKIVQIPSLSTKIGDAILSEEETSNPEPTWGRGNNAIKISEMETSHIANALWSIIGKYGYISAFAQVNIDSVSELIKEFEKRTDVKPADFNKYANAIAVLEDEKYMTQNYNIRIQSSFILTQSQVKSKLGPGFKVLEVLADKDFTPAPITDVDSAMEQIVLSGYRALARAHHPDLGGDQEVMVILNRTKKELLDLLKDLKS